jgi:hypothetical protein
MCACLPPQNIYFSPINPETSQAFSARFNEFLPHHTTSTATTTTSSSSGGGASSAGTPSITVTAPAPAPMGCTRPVSLLVYGHALQVPAHVPGRRTASFTFHSLCALAYGPADYIELAHIYHVLFITDIPRMNMTHKNEVAKRILSTTPSVEGRITLYLYLVFILRRFCICNCIAAQVHHADRRDVREQGAGGAARRGLHHRPLYSGLCSHHHHHHQQQQHQ